MAKQKLNAPYVISDTSREAIAEGVHPSKRAESVTGYARLRRGNTTVNTVEDASRVSRELSAVNKKLRAARQTRSN